MNTNELRNYIFIDRQMIDMYYEQLNQGEILVEEKHKSSTLSMSLKNISYERHNNLITREATYYEKIKVIEENITTYKLDDNEIDYERLEYVFINDNKRFIRDTMVLQKVLIPSKGILPNDLTIGLWISPNDYILEKKKSIFLIEVFGDVQPFSFCTGYTALQFLLYKLEEKFGIDSCSLLGIDKKQINTRKFYDDPFRKFAQDPLKYLSNLGFVAADKKEVTSLFRVRLEFADYLRNPWVPGIIGYPLYIYD